MAEQMVVIASAHGLHARPASLFTQAAARSALPVKIANGGEAVNASSNLGVISLGIAELAEFLSTDFDAK